MRRKAGYDWGFLKAAACVFVLAALPVVAQQQVNTMARTSVNNAVYAGTSSSGSVRYAGVNPSVHKQTSVPMRSEFRYAYYKSGATPSDVRTGYAALGPMIESGPLSYIDYKPSYQSKKPGPPVPQVNASDAAAAGSIRYSAPSRGQSSAAVSPQAIDALIKPSASVPSPQTNLAISSSLNSMGSVKYAR
jgi:hypothetical protein